MRKSIWGYNVREVDEAIEFLEQQNDVLNDKVKLLNKEAAAVRNRVEQLEQEKSALEARLRDKEVEAGELGVRIEETNARNQALRQKWKAAMVTMKETTDALLEQLDSES